MVNDFVPDGAERWSAAEGRHVQVSMQHLLAIAMVTCAPRLPPPPAPLSACTASLPDAGPWQETAIPGLHLTLRLPPRTDSAPASMHFGPAQAMWQIQGPDSAYGFVAVWVAPTVTTTDTSSESADATTSRCDLVLAGRPVELITRIRFTWLGLSYAASGYWPQSSDSSLVLWAQAPSASGPRTGIAVLRSLWPRPLAA